MGAELLAGAVEKLLKKGGVISEVLNRGTDYGAAAAWEKGGEYKYTTTLVQPSGETLARLAAWIDEGKFVCKVVERLPLQEAGRAQDICIGGHAGGKVVLLP